MTESEIQTIVSEVLAAIGVNSRTIEELTSVADLAASDYFEISGGRKVSYDVLAGLITELSSGQLDDMMAAIARKELDSVAVTATADSATLTIQSVGKTIQCTIPVVSSTSGGILTASDKVKLDSAKATADEALELARAGMSVAEGAAAVTDTLGEPGGLATLDGAGLLTASQLPLGHTSSTAYPGDEGAAVAALAAGARVFPFDVMVYHTGAELTAYPEGTVAWAADRRQFVVKTGDGYTLAAGYHSVGEDGNLTARGDCLYRCGNRLHAYMDGSLQEYVVGAERFNNISERVEDLAILPFAGIRRDGGRYPIAGIWYRQEDGRGLFELYEAGARYSAGEYNVTRATADGGSVDEARGDKVYRCRGDLYHYIGGRLEKIGQNRREYLTQEEYDALEAAGELDEDTEYNIYEE